MAECHQKQNLNICNCTYEPCERKGICCSCISYHKSRAELPACFFSKEAEKTYDRSISHFVTINSR